jgi:hypothetical protein
MHTSEVYYSPWELLDRAENGETDLDNYYRASRHVSKEFTGTDTFQEAVELAKRGWYEGADQVAHLCALWSIDLTSIVKHSREGRWQQAGSRVSVPRYLQGTPQNMRKRVRVHKRKPAQLVKIVVSCSISGWIDRWAITTRGAALVAAVVAIERAGYPVEVWTEEFVKGRSSRDSYCVKVLLKKPEDPLDLSLLSYYLAHPSFLRRLLFSIQECQPKGVRDSLGFHSSGGYGIPADGPLDTDTTLYIPCMSYENRTWDTPESTKAWVTASLEQIGISLEGVA